MYLFDGAARKHLVRGARRRERRKDGKAISGFIDCWGGTSIWLIDVALFRQNQQMECKPNLFPTGRKMCIFLSSNQLNSFCEICANQYWYKMYSKFFIHPEREKTHPKHTSRCLSDARIFAKWSQNNETNLRPHVHWLLMRLERRFMRSGNKNELILQRVPWVASLQTFNRYWARDIRSGKQKGRVLIHFLLRWRRTAKSLSLVNKFSQFTGCARHESGCMLNIMPAVGAWVPAGWSRENRFRMHHLVWWACTMSCMQGRYRPLHN